jgi:hypothetical protein
MALLSTRAAKAHGVVARWIAENRCWEASGRHANCVVAVEAAAGARGRPAR